MVLRSLLIFLLAASPLLHQVLAPVGGVGCGGCCAASTVQGAAPASCCEPASTSCCQESAPTPESPCCPCGDACVCFAPAAPDRARPMPAIPPTTPELPFERSEAVAVSHIALDPGFHRTIRALGDEVDPGPPRAGRRRLVLDSVLRL